LIDHGGPFFFCNYSGIQCGSLYLRCLDSIYDQDFEENKYEVIVVNDGTPDHSMDIVEKYANIHQNIIIIDKDNGGVSSARNAGISVAKGVYLIFVDPDDALEPKVLKTICDELRQADIEILILNSFEQKMDRDVKSEIQIFPRKLTGSTLSGIELFKKGYLGKTSVWGIVFKRLFILEHGLEFPEFLLNGEDTLFMALCFAFAVKVKHVDLNFYCYMVRNDSASQAWDYENVHLIYLHFDDMRRYFERDVFSSDQKIIIHFHIYRTFSYILHRFFEVHCLNKYFEIKHAVFDSGYYPIEVKPLKQFRAKIMLLNFSFGLYCFTLFVRQLFLDIFKKRNE